MKKALTQPTDLTVYIVDDDPAVRSALGLLIRSTGLHAQTYPSARDFLFHYRRDGPACLVLDIRMPEMDGLELQAILQENADPIPIIMITGQGDISMAVQAIKQGAFDFIEKPFPQGRLVQLVRQALELDRQRYQGGSSRKTLERRIDSLTPREHDILDGILQGKQSKVVAADLGISPRTVEAHRSHILHKLGVRSLVELLRKTLPLELHESEKGTH